MESESDKLLRELAVKLERWANEARSGGWSTQNVEPMRQEAQRIWSHLGRSGTYAMTDGRVTH